MEACRKLESVVREGGVGLRAVCHGERRWRDGPGPGGRRGETMHRELEVEAQLAGGSMYMRHVLHSAQPSEIIGA